MGVPIDAVTEKQAVAEVIARCRIDEGGVIVTPNLDHLRSFGADAAVRRFYGRADLVLADGMPLVWASRIAGTPLPERVPGSNLIWSLSAAAAAAGVSVYLLGGNPGAADEAAATLVEHFPGLLIAGTYCPPMGFERDPQQIAAISERLAVTDAGIVFVGLPLPKQISLIEPLSERFPRRWFLGVGISFSFVSGQVGRAPQWMQRHGVEWVHRLVQEPRRLARRYVIEGIPAGTRLLAGAAMARWRGRRAH